MHQHNLVNELGAESLRGDIEDLSKLRAAANQVDGVVHLAFTMDFSNFREPVLSTELPFRA